MGQFGKLNRAIFACFRGFNFPEWEFSISKITKSPQNQEKINFCVDKFLQITDFLWFAWIKFSSAKINIFNFHMGAQRKICISVNEISTKMLTFHMIKLTISSSVMAYTPWARKKILDSGPPCVWQKVDCARGTKNSFFSSTLHWRI